ARESERQLREEQQRDADYHEETAVDLYPVNVGVEHRLIPARQRLRVDEEQLVEAAPDDDDVEQQVGSDEHDGEADGLLEPLEEDRPKQRDEYQRDDDAMVE